MLDKYSKKSLNFNNVSTINLLRVANANDVKKKFRNFFYKLDSKVTGEDLVMFTFKV